MSAIGNFLAAALLLAGSAGLAGERPAAGGDARAAPGQEAKAADGKGRPAESRDALDRFLAAWADRMKDLKTLEVRFRQEKKLRILRRPLISRGTILLSVPDRRLLSTVAGDDGKPETVIAAKADRVEIYYSALRRLEVYDLGAGAAPPVAFPGLGGDVAALKRDYEVRLERGPGGDRLTLVPRDAASPIRELRLLLADYKPKELVQVDRSGDSVRLEIEEFRMNPPLSAADLKLEVPPGTEEVHPLGKREGAPREGPGDGRAAPPPSGGQPPAGGQALPGGKAPGGQPPAGAGAGAPGTSPR